MKKRFLAIALALVLLLSVASVAAASLPAPQTGSTYRALLIGNANYGAGMQALPGSLTDALAMHAALSTSDLAYKTLELKVDQTAAGIAAALKSVASSNIGDRDVTLIYYSGHGYKADGGGIVGVDGKNYSFASMQRALSGLNGKVIIVLDACYSGKLIGKSAAAPDVDGPAAFNRAAIAAFASPQAKAINSGTQFHVITSSSQDQLSWATNPPDAYSFATYYLTEGMGYDYLADKETELYGDGDEDGYLTVSEAYEYASPLVAGALSPRYIQDMQIYPSDSRLTMMTRQASEEPVITPTPSPTPGPTAPPSSHKDVALNVNKATIGAGATLELSANQAVTWKSDNEKVAKVDQNGRVTGVSNGKTVIQAIRTGDNSSDHVAECMITVVTKRYAVQNIALNKYKATLRAGKTGKLTVKYTPSSARYKTSTWVSSDPAVAKVSKTGVITAVSEGTAVITATASNGQQKVCEISVLPAQVSKIKLNHSTLTLVDEYSAGTKLAASVSPSYAGNKDLIWSSSNEKYVKVDADGVVTPVAPGRASVIATAADGSKAKAVCKVTVVKNGVSYSKPRTKSGKLTTSPYRISYDDENLVVQMFYNNKTRKSYMVPAKSNLKLTYSTKVNGKTVKKSAILEVQLVDQEIVNVGETVKITYRISRAKNPAIANVDLRKADASIQ